MASPKHNYYLGPELTTIEPHHASFKALWETKWKRPCQMGVYPFMFGNYRDFDPVAQELINQDMKEPYDWDRYAACFSSKAQELCDKAAAAEASGDSKSASEYYLRASAVLRISRFPIPRSDEQRSAWHKGRDAAIRGLSLLNPPVAAINISHIAGSNEDGPIIPALYRKPTEAQASNKVPLVILVCGLDGYRTDLAIHTDSWIKLGCSVLILDIPGTGDCPAAPSDPLSPDRLWDSIFAWISDQDEVDPSRVVVWGFSTGGYYALRVAHTHIGKLAGVVAHGGGCHHMFDPEWLDEVNHLEYPFDLANALCYKFGYGSDLERFKKEARAKFSLLETGILDRLECSNLFVVNGMKDSIFPIDDSFLCLQHGAPKTAKFVPNSGHMGEPESFNLILPWLWKQIGIVGNVKEFFSNMISY